MKNLSIKSIILACTFFFTIQLTAQVNVFQLPSYVSLDMNNIPQNLSCGTMWSENNATFQITSTGNEVTCPGYCFAQSKGKSLWLAPSSVKVDISNVMLDAPVHNVYVNLKAYSGIGGTKAILVARNGSWIDLEINKVTGRSEIIILNNPNGLPLSHIIISACETEVINMGIESKTYVPSGEINQNPVYEVFPQSNYPQSFQVVEFNGGF